MPNLKIFAIILFFMGVLYVGLERLPHYYPSAESKHVELIQGKDKQEVSQAIESKEQTRKNRMGYTIIGYFLVLSLLLYAKIILQRIPHKER